MSPIHVRDDGPRNARLVLIGEAPGPRELEKGLPFIGPAGGRLACWWRMVGLSRSDFYITNVLPYRPESIDKVPREEMESFIAQLHVRLADLDGPLIIVPTGNYALYALTRKGKVSWHKKDGRLVRPGIMDWRGSILSYTNLNGREIKVVPTIHPAHVLRQPALERRAILDWRRIAGEVEHTCRDGVIRDLPCVLCGVIESPMDLPDVHHHISPTIEDVELFAAKALAEGKPVGLDIETPRGRYTEFQMLDGTWRSHVKKSEQALVARYKSGKKKGDLKTRTKRGRSYVGCVGLANSLDYSITVPLTLEYWKSKEKLGRAKTAFQAILEAEHLDKVVQNGVSFDLPRLLHEGYSVAGKVWDTRAMHHALDPRDDHDLAYMASILTRFPFWKHEAKDPDAIEKYTSNSEALWTYCGIDTVSMLMIFYELRARLRERGLLGFYHRHYTILIPAILDMTMHGVAVDDERRAAELLKLDSEAVTLTKEITEAAGMPIVARKGLSNDRLKFLFYGHRGFEGSKGEASYAKLLKTYPDVMPMGLTPVRKKNTTGGRSITVDEVTIRTLIIKHPTYLGTLGPMLLDFRRNRKKAEFLDGKALDPDRRLRCSYSFVTEAGRFASSSTPWGTGRNLQNIDRELRYVFVPDRKKEKDDGKD